VSVVFVGTCRLNCKLELFVESVVVGGQQGDYGLINLIDRKSILIDTENLPVFNVHIDKGHERRMRNDRISIHVGSSSSIENES